MSTQLQDQQQQNQKVNDKKNIELMDMAEYQRLEALRQQGQATETEIDFGEKKSLRSTIDSAYNKFVNQKKEQDKITHWEDKHNITDKPKLSSGAQVGLIATGIATTLVLFSVATMGLPLVALVAVPLLIGGLIAANHYFKQANAPASDTTPWCKDQRELVSNANITDIITELKNANQACKTKDFIQVNQLINFIKNSANGMGKRHMSTQQLKDKLSELSTYVTQCEELISRNQQLDQEIKGLKQGILALPDNKQRSDLYTKYNELEGKLEKGATSITYREASDMRRELSNELSQIQAALPPKVTAIPVTPKSANPSSHNMTQAAVSTVLPQQDPTLSQGVTMRTNPGQ